MNKLPPELFPIIFKNIESNSDLIKLRRVCKLFRDVIDQNSLIKELYLNKNCDDDNRAWFYSKEKVNKRNRIKLFNQDYNKIIKFFKSLIYNHQFSIFKNVKKIIIDNLDYETTKLLVQYFEKLEHLEFEIRLTRDLNKNYIQLNHQNLKILSANFHQFQSCYVTDTRLKSIEFYCPKLEVFGTNESLSKMNLTNSYDKIKYLEIDFTYNKEINLDRFANLKTFNLKWCSILCDNPSEYNLIEPTIINLLEHKINQNKEYQILLNDNVLESIDDAKKRISIYRAYRYY